MVNIDYKEDLDKLIMWANERGYSVDVSPDGDNSVDGESKIIFISSKRTTDYQVCVLLHECGHIQIFENKGTLNMTDSKSQWSEASRKHRASILIEEVEAWRRGINLSRKLKLSIDIDTIKLNMINAILKYAKWC